MRDGIHIGELAARFGLNPKTIRYYEEIGLLPRAARSASGYRWYDEQDIERLALSGGQKRSACLSMRSAAFSPPRPEARHLVVRCLTSSIRRSRSLTSGWPNSLPSALNFLPYTQPGAKRTRVSGIVELLGASVPSLNSRPRCKTIPKRRPCSSLQDTDTAYLSRTSSPP